MNMKDETLSSKIVHGQREYWGLTFIKLEDVKDFIQKLKEEYLKIPQRIFIKAGDDEILKMIDKLAGDALIHSPELAKKTGTPDDMGICNPGNSSGTQLCAKCGHEESEHHKGEVYHVVPGAGVRISECKKFITPKIGCTNHHNLPSRIEHGDKSEGLPSDFYKENLRELYEIMKKEGITTIEQLEKRFGSHNQDYTNNYTRQTKGRKAIKTALPLGVTGQLPAGSGRLATHKTAETSDNQNCANHHTHGKALGHSGKRSLPPVTSSDKGDSAK